MIVARLLRYIVVFSMFFSDSSAWAEPSEAYVKVLTNVEMAKRCGLRINATTEAWVRTLAELAPPGDNPKGTGAAIDQANIYFNDSAVDACINARKELLEEGWL